MIQKQAKGGASYENLTFDYQAKHVDEGKRKN
jgi:hypothetical protein